MKKVEREKEKNPRLPQLQPLSARYNPIPQKSQKNKGDREIKKERWRERASEMRKDNFRDRRKEKGERRKMGDERIKRKRGM